MTQSDTDTVKTAAVLVAIIAVGMAGGWLIGNAEFGYDYLVPLEPTPTPTPEVIDRQVTSGTVSLEGLPVSQKFRFQNGDVYAEFPIRVEFQRPNAGNWTLVHTFSVEEREWFTVELIGGQRYRIVIEDSTGERRLMGSYIPGKRNAEHTILIGGCCIDDFSRKN